MSDTICGYERGELRKALEFANSSNLDTVSRNWPRPNDGGAILFDVHDPAKLAEMLAQRGRQLGFGAYYGRLVSPERYPMLVFTHGEIEVHIRIAADRSEFGAYSFVRTYLMPSARALLAAWLALPDGDRVGAEKALRSVT